MGLLAREGSEHERVGLARMISYLPSIPSPFEKNRRGPEILDCGNPMTEDQFRELIHVAQHELTTLNENCHAEHGLGLFDHWQYDAEEGTIVFRGGSPSVRASVQVVGTSSAESRSWLWAWANESVPRHQSLASQEVRTFGEREGIPMLVSAEWADDEYFGWEMTAITTKLTGAVGGYRTPRDSGGYKYYVFSKLEKL